jgi:hypothetical protein
MKKFAMIAATFVLGMQMSVAQAAMIKINTAGFGGAWGVTDAFADLVITPFQPTSVYTESSPGAGIQFGDAVKDVGKSTIAALSPLGFGQNKAGFGVNWGMDIDWVLNGTAVLAGGDYLGNFTSGKVNFTFDLGGGNKVLGLTVDILGTQLGTVGTGGIGVNVFGKVSYALANTFFDSNGNDFNDSALIFAFANTDVKGTSIAPTQGACTGANAVAGNYCRTTQFGTVDVNFANGVPEPASIAILGLGLLGLGFSARRKQAA